MLNCRRSLENERSSECWGGVSADPVVSAVLNAVGKRFVVEIIDTEDGFHCVRYSDGYIEINALIPEGSFAGGSQPSITFPIAFSNTDYVLVPAPTSGSSQYSITNVREVSGTRTTTGVTLKCMYSTGGDVQAATGDLNIFICGY